MKNKKRILIIALVVVLNDGLVEANPTTNIAHDPIMYLEQAAQTAVLLDLVSQQVVIITEAYKEAERQIKMVTQLPAKVFNTVTIFIDDQIATINEIGSGVEELIIRAGDTLVNAEDLFLSDDAYSSWFDGSLTLDERRKVIERDINRADIIRDITRNNSEEAYTLGQRLYAQLDKGFVQIKDQIKNVAGTDSVVGQLQAANAISAETYIIMAEVAKQMALISRAMTTYYYGQQEASRMKFSADSVPCPPGYYRDFNGNCTETKKPDSFEKVLEEATTPFDEMGNTEINRRRKERLKEMGF